MIAGRSFSYSDIRQLSYTQSYLQILVKHGDQPTRFKIFFPDNKSKYIQPDLTKYGGISLINNLSKKIQNKLKFRRAHIISITERYFVIEASGLKEDIDNMYDKLKPYGLLQFVRSGRIAITKPKMAISELLEEIN